MIDSTLPVVHADDAQDYTEVQGEGTVEVGDAVVAAKDIVSLTARWWVQKLEGDEVEVDDWWRY